MNEDQIIADAFVKIREAIVTANWQLVIDAYFDISGEELELPTKPKSRLEKIRESIQAQTPKEPDEEVDPEDQSEPLPQVVSIEAMTVKDLKSYLVGIGINEKDLKSKNKKQLLSMLPQATINEPVSQGNHEIEIKGGDKFGRGTIKIISDGYDPIEAELNKLKNRRKTSSAPRKNTAIEDSSDDVSANHRFHSKPTIAPPWR